MGVSLGPPALSTCRVALSRDACHSKRYQWERKSHLGVPGACEVEEASDLAETSRSATSRLAQAFVLMADVLSNSWLAAVDRIARSLESTWGPLPLWEDTSCTHDTLSSPATVTAPAGEHPLSRADAPHLGRGPGRVQDPVQVVQVLQDHEPGAAQVVVQAVRDIEERAQGLHVLGRQHKRVLHGRDACAAGGRDAPCQLRLACNRRSPASGVHAAVLDRGVVRSTGVASLFEVEGTPPDAASGWGLTASPWEASEGDSVNLQRLARKASRGSTMSSTPQACVKEEYACPWQPSARSQHTQGQGVGEWKQSGGAWGRTLRSCSTRASAEAAARLRESTGSTVRQVASTRAAQVRGSGGALSETCPFSLVRASVRASTAATKPRMLSMASMQRYAAATSGPSTV